MAGKKGRSAKLPSHTFTRVLDAPRDLVWDAWTTGEHLAAWFAPRGFTTPRASIEPKSGGQMLIVMRSPDGQEFQSTGVVKEARAPERLVFSSTLNGSDGKPMLVDLTTVTFADAKGKTKLTVTAQVTYMTDEAAGAISGMEQGWNETLDKMEEHLSTLRPKRASL